MDDLKDFVENQNNAISILKNRDREQYNTALNFLTNASQEMSPTKIFYADYQLCLCNEVLQLIFDEDTTIQEKAISVLQSNIKHVQEPSFQNKEIWLSIKKLMVDNFTIKLESFLQRGYRNWYKIWCLLIRILDKEILKGATVINTFLTIVEFAFRSNDYQSRSEAFICWKVMAEIFHKYNELSSPRRIKLISIPLKSSHSKTCETTMNKLYVWWYVICKLDINALCYSETILEPFLSFCFGQRDDNLNIKVMAMARIYPKVKEFAITCLTALLGPIFNDKLCEKLNIDRPANTILNSTALAKFPQLIFFSCLEATILLKESTNLSIDSENLCQQLWKNIQSQIITSNNFETYEECFKKINNIIQWDGFKKIPNLNKELSNILKIICTCNEFPFNAKIQSYFNVNKFTKVIHLILVIISNDKLMCPPDIQNEIIKNIINLSKFEELIRYNEIQLNLMELIINDSENNISLNVKFSIWNELSKQLSIYLVEQIFEYRINKNAEILNNWLIWPLEKFNTNYNKQFLEIWKSLCSAASKAEDTIIFSDTISSSLKNLYETKKIQESFPEIIGCFVSCLDMTFDDKSKPSIALEFIKQLLIEHSNKLTSLNNNVIVENLSNYLHKLGESQILNLFDWLKLIYKILIKSVGNTVIDKNILDEFRKTIEEKLKTFKIKDKKLLKEFKEVAKSDSNDFIVISKTWAFNPDKLTEHQKEKMKEKREDIPALYNDMSQSREVSIKAWTPSKPETLKNKSNNDAAKENKIEQKDEQNISVVISDTNAEAKTKKLSPPMLKVKVEANEESVNNPPYHENRQHSDKKKGKKCNVAEQKYESLLNEYNINVDGKEKKKKVLKELKSIEIDTVEGNLFIPQKLRPKKTNKSDEKKQRRSTSLEAEIAKVPRITNSGKKSESSKNAEKTSKNIKSEKRKNGSLHSLKKKSEKQEPDSMDEVVESSQESESVIMKKLPLRRSLNFVSNVTALSKKSTTISNTSKDREPKQTPKVATNISANLDISVSDGIEKLVEEENKLETVKIDKKTETNSKLIENAKVPPISQLDTQPNTESFDNTTLNRVQLDTEPNTESLENTPLSSILSNNYEQAVCDTLKKKSLTKTFPIENVCEADTELNTESFLVPTAQDNIFSKESENIVSNLSTSSLFSKLDSNVRPESPSMCNESLSSEECIKENLSRSVLSSPELRDANERNVEFLNNTLDISPILNEGKPTSNNIEKGSSKIQLPIDLPITRETPANVLERKEIEQYDNITNETNNGNNSALNTIANATQVANRPKIFSRMTSRGAQCINMIRNKSRPNESLSRLFCEGKETPPLDTINQPEQTSNVSPPRNEDVVNGCASRDLLIFSKKIPSPDASPSVSILKRKMLLDSFDDESPALKRKRVSFHDPPVSVTKEYVRTDEEINLKSNQSYKFSIGEKTSTPHLTNRFKQSLKRKSRIESLSEIRKLIDSSGTIIDLKSEKQSLDQISVEMEDLKWNASRDDTENEIEEKIDNNVIEEENDALTPPICFQDEDAILQHVFSKYELADLIEKYIEDGKGVSAKSVRIFMNQISSSMDTDEKLKINTLEMLSEKYPNDFLQHAIQENPSLVVCEKLNVNSVLEFIQNKASVDPDIHTKLFEYVNKTFETENWTDKIFQLVISLLGKHNMSKDEIFKCIEIIYGRYGGIKDKSPL